MPILSEHDCARYLESTGLPSAAAAEKCADATTRACVSCLSGAEPTIDALACCYGPNTSCQPEEA